MVHLFYWGLNRAVVKTIPRFRFLKSDLQWKKGVFVFGKHSKTQFSKAKEENTIKRWVSS